MTAFRKFCARHPSTAAFIVLAIAAVSLIGE